ncbi:MAG TPA: SMP-30/gluconolactonase/LRE family protein [Hansschlegelia sp.]
MATSAVAAAGVVPLPEGSPFPESVTAIADGTLFVSSISNGGVLRVAPDGSTPTPFFKPGEHDTRSTFGVLADEKTGTLWVASNDASAIGLKGPSAVEGAWLRSFDLKSGAPKVSVRLPAPAIANDFAIGEDGSIYVTNTAGPQIYRLKPDANEVEVFVQDDRLKGGLDGIAFGEDGNLYVNTYVAGEMFRVDVKMGAAGKVTKLKTSRPLTHPDGLKPFKDGFLMVEGGGALDRVTIAGDEARIDTVKTFAGPTGVTIAGDAVWVAEGQLSYLSDPDKKGKTPDGFRLIAIPLPKD